MKKIINPRITLCLSMAIFGTLALFTRNIDLSSGELALYRAILAAIFIMIYMAATKQHIDFKKIKRDIPLLLISGMAMGINWILLFQAYHYTTVSVATLSYYFAPMIVTVVCPFLFKEKLTVKQIICFIMSTIGLVLIIGIGSVEQKASHLTGILLGLGAAVFYATVVLLNKFIKNVAGIHRTLLQFTAAIIIFIPYTALTGGVHLSNLNVTGWICLFVVGIVHTGISYCMYFSSLKKISGQEAAILSYIDPLVAVLLSVLILKESINPWQIIGGVLILGFTVLNEIKITNHK